MCAQVIEKRFSDNLKILENLNIQRQNGNLCDFTLKTQDGGSFSVHKAIIATASSFFEAKFRNTRFGDSKSDSVELPRVSTDVLGKIIEFMYTSEITISSEFAKEMLDIALFLGLNSLVDGCTGILVQIVDQENCFDMLNYAETYHRSEKLTNKCIEVILKNVHAIVNSPGFNEISFDGMKKLVSIDRDGFSEESICLAAMKWISFDLKQREQYIQSLLDAVSFEKLSNEFCLTSIFRNNLLLDNLVFLKKLIKIQERNAQLLVEHDKGKTPVLLAKTDVDLTETVVTVDRKVQFPFRVNIYAVFNYKFQIFNEHERDYFKLITSGIQNRRFGYTNFKKYNFFICGGLIKNESTKMCKYFSFDENCWKELPSMPVPRYDHRTVTINDRIYACGCEGWNGNIVEIFDTNRICWTKGPSLPQHMANFGLCILDNCIYATYGKDLCRFDTRKDNWTTLSTSCTFKNANCSSIGFDNFIYRFDKKEIQKFDLRNNKWIEEERKGYEVCFEQIPQVCKAEDEIYICGDKLYFSRPYNYSLQIYSASNLNILKNYTIGSYLFEFVEALFTTDF